jgi:hypothetical protein
VKLRCVAKTRKNAPPQARRGQRQTWRSERQTARAQLAHPTVLLQPGFPTPVASSPVSTPVLVLVLHAQRTRSLCARDCSGSPVSHRPVPSHPPHDQPAVTIIPSQHCRAPLGRIPSSQNRSTVRKRGRETSTPVPGVAALALRKRYLAVVWLAVESSRVERF